MNVHFPFHNPVRSPIPFFSHYQRFPWQGINCCALFVTFGWSYSFKFQILGDIPSVGVSCNSSAEVNGTMKAYTIIKQLHQDIKLISLTPDIMELNESENKHL